MSPKKKGKRKKEKYELASNIKPQNKVAVAKTKTPTNWAPEMRGLAITPSQKPSPVHYSEWSVKCHKKKTAVIALSTKYKLSNKDRVL